MTTAADRIQKAVAKRRTSLAAVARDANLPAGWVRSVATGHITKPDPVRLAAIAAVLALDYRELLALTDQLGAAETIEVAATGAGQSADVAALLAMVQGLITTIDAERAEWREERRALWERLDRILPPSGATPPVEPDSFESSALTEAGRLAAELAHDEMASEAVRDPAASPRLSAVPRTPAGRTKR